MIIKCCAVFDRAVNAYGTPFFVQSDNAAIRSFRNEVNNAGSPFNSNPDDYDLYAIADFDSDSGIVTGSGTLLLCRGKDVVSD